MAGEYAGRSALVTGGGSGIGAAISRALVAAGAHVTVADLNVTAASDVAANANGPGTAASRQLDVTDADDVRASVEEVVAGHGRLDMIFNNAGIGVGGNAEDLSVADWNRVLDVNVRGVVHGIAAAYPVMVAQGSGHIVNTASLAGLLGAGLLAPYSTSKFAVVGLSQSLRAEAATRGVKVLVVCPSAVETAILAGPGVGGFDIRRYVTTDQGVKQPLGPDVLAAEVLAAMVKNRAMLVTPRSARIAWRVTRLAPGLGQLLGRRVVARQRQAMDHG